MNIKPGDSVLHRILITAPGPSNAYRERWHEGVVVKIYNAAAKVRFKNNGSALMKICQLNSLKRKDT